MQRYIEERCPGIRTKDGKINVSMLLLLSVYVAAASAYIPTALFGDLLAPYPYAATLLSVAMPIAGIGVCIMLTVSPKPIIPFCIITAIIMFMGASLTLSSVLCVFFTLTAIYAYLLREKFWWSAAISTAVSFGALLILSKGFVLPLLSLVYIPIAVTLFLVFKQKKQRVASVATMSACMALIVAVMLTVWIYVSDGSISPSAFRTFFDTLRIDIVSAMSEALAKASGTLGAGVTQADALSLANATVNMTFNLFPAIVAIILFVVSFITHSLYISLISVTLDDQNEITNAVTFNMSVTSAVIFMIAYILALILSYEKLPLYAAMAQNIYTILFPGFTMIAFGFVGSLVRSGKAACLGTILYIGMFAMLFFLTDVTLVLASFTGAILVIAAAIKSKTSKK